MMNLVLTVLGALMFGLAIHLVARILTMRWAERDTFFCSPAFGRIKARIRAGRIIQYIGNLKGLNVHVDEATGQILMGEERSWSFWRKVYGVRFIGLDDVHWYDIEVTEIDKEGNAKTKIEKAHSLHYSGSYHLVLTGQETIEGIPVGMRLRFTLRTHHAGECLKFKNNWISVAHSAIKAATRDFVGKNKARSLLQMQNEQPSSTTDSFVELIRSLNDSTSGNPGLIETLGQEIISVNLESIVIEDQQMADSLEAQEMAVERGKGAVAAAQAEAEKIRIEASAALFKTQQEAEGRKAQGMAENAILRDRVATLGGPNGLIGLKKWEAIASLKDLKGTLLMTDKEGKDLPVVLPVTGFQQSEKK